MVRCDADRLDKARALVLGEVVPTQQTDSWISFGRIGAALAMKVEDVFVQNRRLWVRLREKGGKRHEMPCHHTLEVYLHAYLDGAGIADDTKGPLFRTIGRDTQRLTRTPCRRPTPTPWCGGARWPLRSTRRSATTASGRRGSPPT